jgi:hypothetical protein
VKGGASPGQQGRLLLREVDQHPELVAGDRRFGAEYGDDGVDLRQEFPRRGAGRQRGRSQARRVHQAQPRAEQRVRDVDLHRANPAGIAGIAALGDIGGEGRGVDVLPGIRQQHARRPPRTVPDDGDHRGHRHDSRGQDRILHQGVDQRRLAALELADAGDEEATLLDPPRQRLGVGGDRAGACLACDPRQLAEPGRLLRPRTVRGRSRRAPGTFVHER